MHLCFVFPRRIISMHFAGAYCTCTTYMTAKIYIFNTLCVCGVLLATISQARQLPRLTHLSLRVYVAGKKTPTAYISIRFSSYVNRECVEWCIFFLLGVFSRFFAVSVLIELMDFGRFCVKWLIILVIDVYKMYMYCYIRCSLVRDNTKHWKSFLLS